MIQITVSFWFVLVSALIHMAIGALWYSDRLFRHEWLRLSGKSEDASSASGKPGDKAGMGRLLAISFAAALIMAYAFALVLKAFEPQSLVESVSIALMIWLGICAATMFGEYIFLERSKKLFLINSAYYLATFAVMSALYMFWH